MEATEKGSSGGVSRVYMPETWIERLPFLGSLTEDWEPVSRAVLTVASAFYALFLVQAARGSALATSMDLVFVPIHEGGHLLFRFFGEFLYVAGGTLMQVGVPFLLAIHFVLRRQVQGAAFCMFFFFEQFLPIATYMADARAQQLPLLTVGDAEFVIHDWEYLFNRFGVLAHDTQIAHVVRVLGWLGMVAAVAWMVYRSLVRGSVQAGTTPRPKEARSQ
jgi:hypothetical protein